ncbi:hypothetical protein RB213_010545 [Colletotrichum asianum]
MDDGMLASTMREKVLVPPPS